MSLLKQEKVELNVCGKIYKVIFDVNVIDNIEEELGIGINDIFNGHLESSKNPKYFRDLAKVIKIVINEDVEIRKDNGEDIDYVTEKEVRRFVSNANSVELTLPLIKAYTLSFKKSDEEVEEDKTPNLASEL